MRSEIAKIFLACFLCTTPSFANTPKENPWGDQIMTVDAAVDLIFQGLRRYFQALDRAAVLLIPEGSENQLVYLRSQGRAAENLTLIGESSNLPDGTENRVNVSLSGRPAGLLILRRQDIIREGFAAKDLLSFKWPLPSTAKSWDFWFPGIGLSVNSKFEGQNQFVRADFYGMMKFFIEEIGSETSRRLRYSFKYSNSEKALTLELEARKMSPGIWERKLRIDGVEKNYSPDIFYSVFNQAIAGSFANLSVYVGTMAAIKLGWPYPSELGL